MRVFVFVLVVNVLVSATAGDVTVTAIGKLLCNGKPIPHSKITLMDEDVLGDQTMATGKTGVDGSFHLTGKGGDAFGGLPDPYVKPEYLYSASDGALSVRPRPNLLIKDDKTKTVKNKKGTVNFGTTNVSSPECDAYLKFLKAVKLYHKRIGQKVPGGTVDVRTRVIIAFGTPYVRYKQIQIPRKYKLSQTTAHHELAHVVRHVYDENLSHFLADVVKFKYLQKHSCSKITNRGFAFNEGWAEFYAGQCNKAGGYKGGHRTEGNVARAFRKLRNNCRVSWFKYVNVLRKNKRKIHSWAEYNTRFKKMYGCSLPT